VDELLHAFNQLISVPVGAACVVLPPSIHMARTQQVLSDSVILWGAQNVYPQNAGAFTGELSGLMLKEYGCRYVLVGHSERRHIFHESEKFVAEKFHHVKDHDMIPVLCVGETQQERDEGLTETVLIRQLQAVIQSAQDLEQCIIAYEPVWAIGTGKTASPEEAQDVHEFIRHWLFGIDEVLAQNTPILYGGSVNERTARSLFAMTDVDGGLVGGASLNALQFVEIVKCMSCC
jgi:triosephosphate isomerase